MGICTSDSDPKSDWFAKCCSVLEIGGVVMAPSPVGFTIFSLEEGIRSIYLIKRQPEKEPMGVLGNAQIFRNVFGRKPPDFDWDQCVGIISTNINQTDVNIPWDCIGSRGEIGIWLNLGPYINRVIDHYWEQRKVVFGSSPNISGKPHPTGNLYDIEHIDQEIRLKVDLVLELPHFARPAFDTEGRWLPSVIIDFDSALLAITNPEEADRNPKRKTIKDGRHKDGICATLESYVVKALHAKAIEVGAIKKYRSSHSSLVYE